MKNLTKLTFLLLLLSITAKVLMPDSTNPITVTPVVANINTQKITARFALPSGASITKGSFIGLDLSEVPKEPYKTLNVGTFTCSLSTDDGKAISVSATKGENSRIFCRISDELKSNTLVPGTKYVLTATIPTLIGVPATFSNIGLFLSTSDSANRINLNSNLSFAVVSPYTDYRIQPENPLNITSISIQVTEGSSTAEATTNNTLPFINDVFKAKIYFSARSLIRSNEVFELRYDTSKFGVPTKISSEDIDQKNVQTLNKVLSGNLTLESVSGGIRIKGFGEDISPNRLFVLVLEGWKANEVPVASSAIEMLVYYRNTETILSYSQLTNAISIQENNLEFVSFVQADNYPYVVSDMSWPMRISVRPKLSQKNVWLIVKANETDKIKYKFLASTCDFSTKGFGASPICFPFDQQGTATSNGLFFFLPSLSANETLTFNVWIHIHTCADFNLLSQTNNSNFLPIELELRTGLENKPQQQSAGVRTANKSFVSDVKCLEGNISGAVETKNARNVAKTYGVTNTENGTTHLYLSTWEVNSLELYNSNDKVTSTAFFVFTGGNNTTVGASIQLGAINANSRVYLNKKDSFTSGTTYTNILANVTNTSASKNFIPTIKADDNLAVGQYLQFILRKKWFSSGSFLINTNVTDKTLKDICWIVWDSSTVNNVSFSSGNILASNNEITDANFNSYNYVTQTLAINVNVNQVNYLFQGNNGNLNLAGSKLPSEKDTHNFYSITGVTMTSNTGNTIPYVLFASTDNYLGLLSNCITLKHNESSSLFDYFEIQAAYRLSTKDDIYTRLIRFISSASMLGVFNNVPAAEVTTVTEEIMYYSVGSMGSKINICLVSIEPQLFTTTVTADTFVVFLYDVSLLETDYKSYNNNYPVGNAKIPGNVYGKSSLLALHSNDPRVLADETSPNGLNNVFGNDLRTIEHTLMASQLWFTKTSSADLSVLTGTSPSRLNVPVYCYEPKLGLNSRPAFSFNWYSSSNYGDSRLQGVVLKNNDSGK